MNPTVVQRQVDGKFWTGIYRAEWSMHVSAARAFLTKNIAIKEMRERGFRLEAMFFEELPVAKARVMYVEESR